MIGECLSLHESNRLLFTNEEKSKHRKITCTNQALYRLRADQAVLYGIVVQTVSYKTYKWLTGASSCTFLD